MIRWFLGFFLAALLGAVAPAAAGPIGGARAVLFAAPPSSFDVYVDSVRGNNNANGKTKAAAFADTTPLATAAINKGVGFARGSVFRSPSLNASALIVPQGGNAGRRIIYGAYGAGPAPQFLGATQIKSGSWANVAGNEYSVSANGNTGPVPGGATPAITWIDGNGVYTSIYKGTSGSLTANQWAISAGLLHVNIGRAPTAADLFEVGFGSSYSIKLDKSHVEIRDIYLAHAGAYGLGGNTISAIDDIVIRNVESAWSAADGINFDLGTATNIRVQDSYIHDTPYDGSGGGDGFSAHGASTGVITSTRFARNGKDGISNSESGTWRYYNNDFNASEIVIYNDTTPGAHVATKNRFYNEPPNRVSGAAFIFVLPSVQAGTTVALYNNSVARGTGTTTMRGIQVSGGTVTAKNNAVWGTGTDGSTKMQFGLLLAAGALTESNSGVGGSTTNYVGVSPTNPATVSTDPYISVATGNLAPGVASPLIGAGVVIAGVTAGAPPDIGYTGVP